MKTATDGTPLVPGETHTAEVFRLLDHTEFGRSAVLAHGGVGGCGVVITDSRTPDEIDAVRDLGVRALVTDPAHRNGRAIDPPENA